MADNQGELVGGGSSEAQQQLNNFWQKSKEDIVNMTANDVRQQELPLARIKRIMKLDEEVKMISAEAPALFSKAAEIFISELTLRAWVHTEDNKRRTLQKNDIAMAITKYDQFDFLIDIVPRDEIKPTKTTRESSSGGIPSDQHYYQIAQQFQTVLQQTAGAANATQASAAGTPQSIQIVHSGGQLQTVQTTASSPVTTQAQPQQTAQIIQLQPQQQQPVQAPQQAPQGGIQIIQQIIGADGQLQQIPIQLTPQQLQMIRLQMSGASQQPIIIQTAPIQTVNQAQQTSGSQPQIIQLQQV